MKIEISSCTPWQHCRSYGLDVPTSSTITGLRGAAGGRHPAASRPPCKYIYIYVGGLSSPAGKRSKGRESNGKPRPPPAEQEPVSKVRHDERKTRTKEWTSSRGNLKTALNVVSKSHSKLSEHTANIIMCTIMLAVCSESLECDFETTFRAVFEFPRDEVHSSVRVFFSSCLTLLTGSCSAGGGLGFPLLSRPFERFPAGEDRPPSI